jgi:hypothetical protein
MISVSDPETWFTPDTGEMVYTFSGAKGLGAGSTRSFSLSKNPKSQSRKLTSQIWSSTSRRPTIWPANTVERLILRLPMQMRPQVVTVTALSWKGYLRSSGPR